MNDETNEYNDIINKIEIGILLFASALIVGAILIMAALVGFCVSMIILFPTL